MPDLGAALTRKLGPLPAWGWGVAIGGSLLAVRMMRGGSTKAPERQLIPTGGEQTEPTTGFLSGLSNQLFELGSRLDDLTNRLNITPTPTPAPAPVVTTPPPGATMPPSGSYEYNVLQALYQGAVKAGTTSLDFVTWAATSVTQTYPDLYSAKQPSTNDNDDEINWDLVAAIYPNTSVNPMS